MTESTSTKDLSERGRDADEPTEIPAAGWKDIALRIKDEYKTDNVSLSASGVAFHAFLAMVPLLVAAVSIYGLFADPSNVTKLVDRLGSSIPKALSDLIRDQLTSVTKSNSGALGVGAIIGLLTALWAASNGMANLMKAVNTAYDEGVDERPFWKKRGIALALTLLLIVFVGVVATLSGLAVAGSGAVGVLLTTVSAVLGAALLTGVLAVIYRYSADRDRPEWSWVSAGAIFAVVGWLIVSVLFTVYVSNFGSYNKTYGALGAIVVVLLWLYISALVVILGAEINAEMEHQTAEDTTQGPNQPMGTRRAQVADEVGHSPS